MTQRKNSLTAPIHRTFKSIKISEGFAGNSLEDLLLKLWSNLNLYGSVILYGLNATAIVIPKSEKPKRQ